jgi:hypothetical protein
MRPITLESVASDERRTTLGGTSGGLRRSANQIMVSALCLPMIIVGCFTSAIGATSAFALNLLAFLASGILLLPLAWRVLKAAKPHNRQGEKAAVRQPRNARLRLVTLMSRPRVIILLTMTVAAMFAADPVLTLAPALSQDLTGHPAAYSGYFLSGLAAGAALGSLFRPLGPHRETPELATRHAARSLLWLACGSLIFAAGISVWASLIAAVMVGMAAVRVCVQVHAGLVLQGQPSVASGIALWMIVWAGAKPVAFLTDGWLATTIDVRVAAIMVAAPAVSLGLLELMLPRPLKARLKESIALTLRSLEGALQPRSTKSHPTPKAATASAAAPGIPRIAPAAMGLTAMVARLTGDQARWDEELRGELWRLASTGKKRHTQLAYALRLFLRVGALRAETRSPHRHEAPI